MASTSKFDLSSSSPDRSLYSCGQRGSYTTSMDNSVSSSHPISRSGSCATQNDVANFFQCLPFDSKSLVADHKFSRPGDVKRNIIVALAISPDDAPSNCSKAKMLASLSLDELKKVKLGLRQSVIKARERVKIFSDALILLSRLFPSIPTKKRSRSEGFDRSGPMLSNDRPNLGSGLSSIFAGNFELGLQKSEERSKGSVPNKRTRTSMLDGKMEARVNSFIRPPVDREKELPKLTNSGVSQCEDRTLSSTGVEVWEKSKMKKKRSGIKPDVSSVVGSLKPGDGYREFKQGMHQRSVNDVCKSNNDLNEVRPGVINGAIGNGKTEGIPQNTGFSARVSIPKAELDSSSIFVDKKDRPVSSDKERNNLKAVNKPSCRDALTSGSPISSSRINPSIRGPRSSSGNATKLSPSTNRASASNDWEVSRCTNKALSAAGAPNCKRSTSVRPPSPVACWSRPQKISRSARRRNFVPMATSNDESSPVDSTSDVVGGEAGLGFPRRQHRNCPQQATLKSETPSSTLLSEGEETEVSDLKFRERLKKTDDMDEKLGQSLQKASPVVASSRKNKLISGEEPGDGIRKQGRNGHGFMTSRTLLPMPGVKAGNEEATHLRNARASFGSKESKPGRSTSRKLSDRKAYNRQRHASVNVAADFMVGSDDGTEELLAAVNAVVAPLHNIPIKMLERVEAAFGFIYDEDIAFLKQQGNIGSAAQKLNSIPMESDDCSNYLDAIGLIEDERKNALDVHKRQKSGKQDQEVVPLWQRLIAAIIPEEELKYCDSDHGDLMIDGEGSGLDLDGQIEPNSSVYQRATNHWHFDSHESHDCSNDNDLADIRGSRIISSSDHPIDGLLDNLVMMPSTGCLVAKYAGMSMDERVLLEMQSISIFPEDVSDVLHFEEDGITDDIQKMVKKYRALVSQKSVCLEKLLKDSVEVKESQERGFEQYAMDKLVTVTYQKYMTCCGPSNAKSAGNKMAKQAALSMVKHTVQRCKQYEVTRKSCFAEPLYIDMFLNGTSSRIVVRPVEAVLEASKNSQHSLSLSQQGLRGDNQNVNSSDMLLSEQASGKEDMWSNRVKKRELLLQEVGGVASVIGNALSSSTKGKRSERDCDGKGQSREILSRPGTNKNGQSALLNSKGERKSKAKPKQKMTQLSISINGLLGNTAEQSKSVLSMGSNLNPMTTSSNSKSFIMNTHDDTEAIDFSSLQIPEIDEFGVSDDLGGRGQDLDSWLNIDDDNLHDDDFMGLKIPMDDLSDVKLML